MLLGKPNPHGGDIYHNKAELDFSSNVNPAGMPEGVRQAICLAAADCTAYPDPYCTVLREKLAEAEQVPAGWILCGNGSAELIYQYAYALQKDRPVLIVEPAFLEYEQAALAAGLGSAHWFLREEDGFCLTDAFLSADLSAYGALFLCSPNNPTGLCIAPSLLHRILEACAEAGTRVFCDLCFLDLTQEPGRYGLPELAEAFPNLTILRAFTKNYAMAGVRLGYAVSSDMDFLERMASAGPCWNVSTLAQAAGIAALENADWLRGSVEAITAERERMREALCAMGLRVYPGEANFLFLYSEFDFPAALLKKGILVRDCTNYAGIGSGYFRIAIRTPKENERLLQAVREVMP